MTIFLNEYRARVCDELRGELLKRGFVAETTGRVARIRFHTAEHRVVDASLVQHLDERAERTLVAHVESALACDQQHIDRTTRLRDLHL